MKKLFITGTDTSCGKTYVTCQLMQSMLNMGKSVIGLKPIASGCEYNNGVLVNDDALKLQRLSSGKINYNTVNPIALKAPVSPHIAANWQEKTVNLEDINNAIDNITDSFDYCFIEGAGGICAPINNIYSWVDYLTLTSLPVIFVVGMKLGCLNHAILTEHYLLSRKVNILGWIANQIDSQMLAYDENINTLRSRLTSPLLTEIPFLAEDINTDFLFGTINELYV
jgi:dethiobiotin synthetase